MAIMIFVGITQGLSLISSLHRSLYLEQVISI